MTFARLFAISLVAAALPAGLVAQDVPSPPAASTAPSPAVVPAPPAAPRANAQAPTRGRGTVVAPTPPVPPVPETPPMPDDRDETRSYRDAVRVGSDYSLAAGSDVWNAAIIMGNAAIDGHVHGDLVVVVGDLRLGPRAVVDGDVAVVGGSVTAAEGAQAHGEFVTVGGTLDAPAGFLPEGEHVVVGNAAMGAVFRSFLPWVTRGLLWGRVIVPGLGWVWWLVGLSVVTYVALVLLFPGAIRSVADTLVSRPLSALFAGLLTFLLFPPVVTVMAITVVGAFVIPFVVLAMFVGGWLGKAAVFTSMGRGVFGPLDPEERLRGLLALAVGLGLVIVLYMVPIVGILTWAAVGTLGLGAASLTAFTAMRRERASRTPPPVVPPVPPGPSPAGADTSVESPAMAFAAAEVPSGDVSSRPQPGDAQAAALPPVDLTAYPRASFLDRLGAGALDVVLVAVANNLLEFDRRGPFDSFFLILLIYCVAFWAWKGTTVGGIVVGLRVIRVDGAALRPVDAVVRGLSSLLSFAALGLGFFWILLASNRERQAWHDVIAGTLVVRVPRHLPLP